MFATLLGGLPTPDAPVGLDAGVEAAIRAQEAAGLEPVTDGRLADPTFEALAGHLERGTADRPFAVELWRRAATLTDRAVKQTLPGPYSLGWREGGDRAARTLHLADALNREVRALADAGCPMVEIEESEAHRIDAGHDADPEHALFAEAHRRLTAGVGGTHLSLSIVGGSADGAGIEAIGAAPYASLAVDLIAGPDNWNLVTRLAGDRGVVVGALSAGETDEPKEVLLWGAHYAASTSGRGIARVGLGSAGSWANLTWVTALRKLHALGAAAQLAALPPGEELARSVDPRSLSARQSALGLPAAGHDHGHREPPGPPRSGVRATPKPTRR